MFFGAWIIMCVFAFSNHIFSIESVFTLESGIDVGPKINVASGIVLQRQ